METATQIFIVLVAPIVLIVSLITRVVIHESHVGLLYRNGRFRCELPAGRHFLWRPGSKIETFDMRRQSMTIPAQELLSKDNIGLKVTLVVNYSLTDARLATESVQHYANELYVAAQLAVRNAISRRTIDEVLDSRAQIGGEVYPIVAEEVAAFGLQVRAVEIKDVMFPAELKRTFAEVIRAREEGRAALERARGESAALRNLANAARLLDGNPGLMNLRLLQSVSSVANSYGNTLVMGVPQNLAEWSGKRDQPPPVHGAPPV